MELPHTATRRAVEPERPAPSPAPTLVATVGSVAPLILINEWRAPQGIGRGVQVLTIKAVTRGPALRALSSATEAAAVGGAYTGAETDETPAP